MRQLQLGIVSVMLITLMGCKTMGEQESIAAIISNPSAESLLELTKAVSTAMDGQSVKIAEDALTTSNELSIKTNTQSMIGNDPINGRIQERPQHFHLMLRGTECYLVHDESGEEYVLEGLSCKALELSEN